MSAELVEPAPTREMTKAEKVLASRIYTAIQRYTTDSERSLQSKDYKAGVSDLGYCSERLKRMLNKETPAETDMMKAFLGTAIGDHVEKAVAANFPGAIIQSEVSVPLEGERGSVYEVGGHPDIILPEEGVLLDGKTSYGLQLAQRVGADQQKEFQRHCYAKGAWLAGFFGDRPLSEVQVGNVWVDRSGKAKELHVNLVPYDEDVVKSAALWLDDVVYAYINDAEARKEPAREVCAVTCGFYEPCRGLETDVTGLLTDETVVQAIEMYVEGHAMEKAGKALKDEAKAPLDGISGSTGEWSLRWIWVNPTDVKAFQKRGYNRIDVKRVK